MDNVVSGQGQPVIINHDRGYGYGGGSCCKTNCCDDLIMSGQFHDAIRHNEHSIRDHACHTDSTIERFGLKTLDELCDVRREVAETKCHLSERILKDGAKTRDLIRDNEIARLREDNAILRLELAAGGGAAARVK